MNPLKPANSTPGPEFATELLSPDRLGLTFLLKGPYANLFLPNFEIPRHEYPKFRNDDNQPPVSRANNEIQPSKYDIRQKLIILKFIDDLNRQEIAVRNELRSKGEPDDVLPARISGASVADIYKLLTHNETAREYLLMNGFSINKEKAEAGYKRYDISPVLPGILKELESYGYLISVQAKSKYSVFNNNYYDHYILTDAGANFLVANFINPKAA